MEENKKGIKKEEIKEESIECFLEFDLIFLGKTEKKERLFSSLKGVAKGAAYVLILSCLNGHSSNTSAQNIVLKIGKESICMPDFFAHSIQEGVKKMELNERGE